MARTRLVKVHRDWEDWLSMLLGVVIGISPWLAGQQDNLVINWNAVPGGRGDRRPGRARGDRAVALGGGGRDGRRRLARRVAVRLRYGDPLRTWHFVLGAAVVLLAAFELWQDSESHRPAVAKHGQ